MTSHFVDTTIEVTSGNAYNLTNYGDTLFVASDGTLLAFDNVDGIDLQAAHQAVTLNGVAYSAGGDAIYAHGDFASIHINGQADGFAGVNLADSYGALSVGATGEVFGREDGLYLGSSSHVSNYGHIWSDTGYAISGHDETGVSITNAGVISSDAGQTIHLYNVTGTIENSGLIANGTDEAFYFDSSTVTVNNTGVIRGSMDGNDNDGPPAITIENSGSWHGAHIDFFNGNASLTNSGSIHANIDMGTGVATVINSGAITGNLSFEGAGDRLTNGGSIHGNVSMGTGETATNTGAIHGNVSFTAGTNTLNSGHGEITGTITGGSGNDTLTGSIRDDDTIFGGSAHDVLTGGNGDDVLNGGTGNDVLTGGRGDDLLTGGGGTDTFKFSGNFGNDTITDFVAGSAAGHGVINFAHNDFGSFSGVQAHMAQVGSDVVITFDATDSIVLQNVTLAHLVSADFTFG